MRAYARGELIDADRRWDVDETSMAEVLPTLEQMGLLSLSIPESAGGLDCDMKTYAALLHEVSYASPSVAVTLSVHSMVTSILSKQAAAHRRGAWLGAMGRADNLCAFAISEADAGSDPSGIGTAAERTGDGFRINGEKMWITNGLSARWFLTLARLRDGGPEGELCMMLVDGRSRGIERTKIRGKMGIRGSETAVIALHEVEIPGDHLVGGVGEGGRVSAITLNEGRVGIASQATGIAEACLDQMIEYAKVRRQFGQPIGRFQAVANMIADSAVELAASKALIASAADKIDAGKADLPSSSMAKLYATEAANRIAYRAVQVHGGMGYVRECRVEQLYRDARVTTIYEGTSEIQRYVIAKGLRQ
ncbi:MAG: Acyl-CoA dehydrogenase [Phycisphaerae bacterium]|nr:Acyl-CoA dehydrogenase [Phycisphaerae bacterium]